MKYQRSMAKMKQQWYGISVMAKIMAAKNNKAIWQSGSGNSDGGKAKIIGENVQSAVGENQRRNGGEKRK